MNRWIVYSASALVLSVAAVGWFAFFALFGADGTLHEAPAISRLSWISITGVLSFAGIYALIPDERR